MSTTWIRAGYGILLGVVLAVTVGFGVTVFMNGPKAPQPAGLTFAELTNNSSTAQENTRTTNKIDGYYSDAQTYKEKYPDFQRNMFLLLAGAGMLLAAIGVALPAVVNYIRFGFVLGGILLVGYGAWFTLQPIPDVAPSGGVAALLSAGTPKAIDTAGRFLRFAVAIVGLLILLFVGLWRLTDWGAGTPMYLGAATPVYVSPAGQAPPAPTTVASVPGPAPSASVATPPTGPDSLKWARPGEGAPAGGVAEPVAGTGDEGRSPAL